jgi:O-antigen/teichoic acid export membrane protein
MSEAVAVSARSSQASTLLRRAVGLFSVGVLGQIAGIGSGIVQAHSLGPAGKAVIAYAALALGMVLTGTDGLSNAVLMQAGRDKGALARIHRALAVLAGSIALPCMLVGMAIGLAVPSQRPLIGAALAIPFAIYAQGSRGLLLATGVTGGVAWQNSITNVFLNVVIVTVLLVGHVQSYAVLALWIGGQAIAAAYTAILVNRTIAERRTAPDCGPSVRSLFLEQLDFGTRSSLATLSGYINMRIDVFLVSAMLGARLLGIYTLAVATGEMIWTLSLPLLYASLQSIAGGTFQDAATLTARLMRTVVALQVVIGLVVFIAGPWLITAVYGQAFAEAGPVMRILMPGLVAYALEMFLGYFILVQIKRPLFIFCIQSASAALCALITVIALPRFGLAGAAFATSVTYVGVVVFKSLLFKLKTGTSMREQWLLRPDDDLRPLIARVRQRLSGA